MLAVDVVVDSVCISDVFVNNVFNFVDTPDMLTGDIVDFVSVSDV